MIKEKQYQEEARHQRHMKVEIIKNNLLIFKILHVFKYCNYVKSNVSPRSLLKCYSHVVFCLLAVLLCLQSHPFQKRTLLALYILLLVLSTDISLFFFNYTVFFKTVVSHAFLLQRILSKFQSPYHCIKAFCFHLLLTAYSINHFCSSLYCSIEQKQLCMVQTLLYFLTSCIFHSVYSDCHFLIVSKFYK